MKTTRLKEFLRSPWLGFIVFLLAIVFSKILAKLELKEVFLSVGFLFAVVVAIFLISKYVDKDHYEEEFETILNRLRELIPEPKFSWLLTAAQIEGMERKTNAKDVWIVSPDLSYDTFKGKLAKAVKNNLARGVTYTFIVPDSDGIKARLPDLQRLFATHPNQLTIKPIPKNTFDLFAVRHIGIEDPLGTNGAPQVFLEIPIEQEGYWIKVAEGPAIALTGRFKALLEPENELRRLEDVASNLPRV